MAETLAFKFILDHEFSEELKKQIEELDHEAFFAASQNENDELANIEWATSDTMALGFLQDRLVTQLCLLKRDITVGGITLSVAGVGGVATRSQWQKQGFSSALLQRSKVFMQNEIKVPFGLLICASELENFYSHNGWQLVANSLWYSQESGRHNLKSPVMVLPLGDQTWPKGEIDLCGYPW